VHVTDISLWMFLDGSCVNAMPFVVEKSSFKIYKIPSARLVVEYLGVVRRELGFKYQDSIRAAQSRPNETREKSKLN